ncbi:unnamed protein product [Rhizophagus irregularis]|nr:unnamed protein product [Rhizophagus irregularis]
MSWEKISVVVGLDFGTTYSGFSYCHTESKNDIVDTKNIRTNDRWPGEVGNLKTNTVLQYDSNFVNVERWGNPALAKQPKKNRPKLPVELRSEESESHEKAITDYLREIGKLIKETVETRKGVDFKENVLLVLTVPAEYSENDKATMRECARKAGLIDLIGNKKSQKLQFTTEPEAAAIYCMKNKLQQYNLLTIGTMFMIVDCVSNQPVAAVVRGATMYGLSLKYSSVAKKLGNRKEYVISTRKLNFTYGIKILSRWKDHHPPNRKVFNDRIYLFETFVKRGKEVEVDEEFISKGYTPLGSTQTALKFELFKTPEKDANYHDEPGMELVGTLRVPLDANRKVTFGFSFGQMEITAFAKNELGQNVQVRFELSKDSVYL